MKFAAVIEYLQDPERVQSLRPAHREYLKGLLGAANWWRRALSPTTAGR